AAGDRESRWRSVTRSAPEGSDASLASICHRGNFLSCMGISSPRSRNLTTTVRPKTSARYKLLLILTWPKRCVRLTKMHNTLCGPPQMVHAIMLCARGSSCEPDAAQHLLLIDAKSTRAARETGRA